MIKKIKQIFGKRKAKKQQNREMIKAIIANVKATDAHLIALARLSFIKPAELVREAQNAKANAEYIVKMTETLQKQLKKEEK